MKIIKSVLHSWGRWYCKRICESEFLTQEFHQIDERSIEYSFVFRQITHVQPKRVLDVGCGVSALPSLIRDCGCLVSAIDNITGYWPSTIFNRHFHVINDDICKVKLQDSFDLITCISVLEHIHDYDEAVSNMFKLLNINGYLILTFPYNESAYISNAYKLPGASYGQDAKHICQIYSRNELDRWISVKKGQIVEQEYWQVFEGEFWASGKRLAFPQQVSREDRHQLTCLMIKKII